MSSKYKVVKNSKLNKFFTTLKKIPNIELSIRRLIAFIIDNTLMSFSVGFVVSLLTSIGFNYTSEELSFRIIPLKILIIIVSLITYCNIQLLIPSQSLGKLICGITVSNSNGFKVLIKGLFIVLLMLNFDLVFDIYKLICVVLFVMFGGFKCPHDYILGTKVDLTNRAIEESKE